MTSELKFEVPSWNDIYKMLIELADEIHKEGFEPHILVGISRGGWLPTRILSDLLENPRITSVGVSFYVGFYETRSEPALTQPLSISAFDKKILLVDDVVDTGKSAILIKNYLERQGAADVKLLTLYYKPWSNVIPDFYSKETKEWIVFPWELKETLRKLRKKYRGKSKLFADAKLRLVSAGVSKELIKLILERMVKT